VTSERRSWRDHPLVQLTLVRYREFFREPEAVFWVFVFPVLLTAGLGIAFRNQAPERTRVVLVNREGAGGLAEALNASPDLQAAVLPDSAAAQALRTGSAAILVVPDSGGRVEYRFDPERPESRTARLQVDDALQRGAGRSDPVAVSEQRVSEPGSRYVDFVVPGLLGMNLMGSGIWGLGFSIVDARRKKLLKRMIATPMSRTQFLASFVLSRLTLLILEVGALLGFALLVFGVPVRGSPLSLLAICLLSALAFGSLGLLLASRTRTIEGASGLMNLVMLPMWIFSGVFFSASRFPDALQPFIQALPLTAVNDALRASMLEGAGWARLVPELGIIATWLVVSFVLAVRLFRWRYCGLLAPDLPLRPVHHRGTEATEGREALPYRTPRTHHEGTKGTKHSNNNKKMLWTPMPLRASEPFADLRGGSVGAGKGRSLCGSVASVALW
jgi:ABC-2 type transport system permease protein